MAKWFNERVDLRLSTDDKRALDALARSHGMTASAFIRYMIRVNHKSFLVMKTGQTKEVQV